MTKKLKKNCLTLCFKFGRGKGRQNHRTAGVGSKGGTSGVEKEGEGEREGSTWRTNEGVGLSLPE